jgi:glycosyltransferase involved in cell wall biosynthesis
VSLPTRRRRRPSVLFAGQSYYHAWYLSRELRKLGWRADVLNWDVAPNAQGFYHGQDYAFSWDEQRPKRSVLRHAAFYLRSLPRYDIFHFSNMHGMRFGHELHDWVATRFHPYAEIEVLRRLGKKIVYSNNGCLDGVSQTSFASWGDRPVCLDCPWRERPDVCSDESNLAWGYDRNRLADFQCNTGDNRKDYNDDPSVHEVPQFFCLDPEFWRPDLEVPQRWRLDLPESTVRIYHAVGNFQKRTANGRNIKSSHIYVPLIERMKAEGYDVEMTFVHDVPNRDVRFTQVQADIVVDMLTFGWFGSNVREAMMLGKPVVCYLREEWLERMRREIPEYIDELPIVSATPETVEDVLKGLVGDPERRRELGERGRAFALKFHSAQAGARRMDQIYRELLSA